MKDERWVLVVSGDGRKGVAVVRSLGRAGFRVGLTSGRSLAIPRLSRYCSRFERLPEAAREPDEFWKALRAHLERRRYEVVVPLEADALEVISLHRSVLPAGTAFPFAAHDVLDRAADKHTVVERASALSIPVPRTRLPAGPGEVAGAARDVGFPAVIKPRRGQGSHGVKLVRSEAELLESYPGIVRRFGPAVVQEFVPSGGGEYGVSLLMDSDRGAVARFSHRRIRSFPVAGGPSTLRESIHEPAIEEYAERLLRDLGWFGVAMVEFRRDPRDGRFKLMEVNHRFWGSLPLAIAAGVDFPALLCRLALGEKVEPRLDYPAGVQCRWLFPGDLMHFLANRERWRMKPSFFRFVAPNLHYDIESLSDPGPMLLLWVQALVDALSPGNWRRMTQREKY